MAVLSSEEKRLRREQELPFIRVRMHTLRTNTHITTNIHVPKTPSIWRCSLLGSKISEIVTGSTAAAAEKRTFASLKYYSPHCAGDIMKFPRFVRLSVEFAHVIRILGPVLAEFALSPLSSSRSLSAESTSSLGEEWPVWKSARTKFPPEKGE